MSKILFTLLFFCVNLHYLVAKQNARQSYPVYTHQNTFAFSSEALYLTLNYAFRGEKTKKVMAELNSTTKPNKNTDSSKLPEKGAFFTRLSFKEIQKDTVLTKDKLHQTCSTKVMFQKTEDMRKTAESSVGEFLKKRYCIDNNLISSYSKEETPVYMARFGPKTKELGKRTEVLNDLVKAGPQNKSTEGLMEYQKKLTGMIKELETGFAEICQADKTLCGCYGS